MLNDIKIAPPIIEDISYFPLSNFSICLPANNPIRDITKVMMTIIVTWRKIQTVSSANASACKLTPTAKASIAVAIPIKKTSL